MISFWLFGIWVMLILGICVFGNQTDRIIKALEDLKK